MKLLNMNIKNELQARSHNKCELCAVVQPDVVYVIPPASEPAIDKSILICQTCHDQIGNAENMDVHHWRCLNDCMWSDVPAVQVVAWRMLSRLSTDESWARDQLEMLYLDDETLKWAQAGADSNPSNSDNETDDTVIHRDSNGAVLASGDTITLTKDLNVKGAGFTAKRGTAVHNISLVHDNAAQLEGRVNGQQIVILTEFVKKSA